MGSPSAAGYQYSLTRPFQPRRGGAGAPATMREASRGFLYYARDLRLGNLSLEIQRWLTRELKKRQQTASPRSATPQLR